MIRSFFSLISVLVVACAFGQQGTITGSVTANEAGKVVPMPFVNVSLKGQSSGVSTDLDGNFTMTAPVGQQVVVVTMVGFPAEERTVQVEEGRTATVNVELKAASTELKGVNVRKAKRAATEAAVVMETRKSEQVVNGVSQQQIAKGQDRTAGDVVKRIPGVTLVGDRFVMVRGLADRYNTVLLNDMPAPSLEPDKRAFSFDLIPSGALDRMMVYKTGAPELPGDFAGGVIKVYTLGVPAENITKVNYSASFRAGTTFEPFLQDRPARFDALGFDDGTRALPSDFPGRLSNVTDPNRLAGLGREMQNNWETQTITAMPDQRASVLFGRRFGKEGGNRYGNVTSLEYTNTFTSYTAKTYNYNVYDQVAQRSDTIYRYTDSENIHNVRISLLHNWTAMLGDRSKIEFRNLFNQLGENRTTYRTGLNFEEGNEVRDYSFHWQQRTIYSGQLRGEHRIGAGDDMLRWGIGYNKALNKEPDLRRLHTTRNIQSGDSNDPYQVQIAPGASTRDAGRFFSDLNESTMNGRVDYEHALGNDSAHVMVKLRGGVFAERKDRSFEARWMSFVRSSIVNFDQSLVYAPLGQIFNDTNINPTTGFKLEEGTNPSDRYTAANTLMAGYVGATANIGSRFIVSGGLRVENNRQELQSGTYNGGKVNVDDQLTALLPSLNASWNITKRALVRVACSNTLNRPEFRELAPFAFYDFSTNTVLSGNPDVRTARITNLDARWEFYPSDAEVISVGGFYKQFTDPIEMFYLASTGGGTRNFTFGNAANATSAGAEVELRRSLNAFFTEGYFSHVGVVMNGSVIKSTVDLGSAAVGQERERPMMGQSPYVANVGLYYDKPESKLQYNVAYNVFGRRLYAVGTAGTPDIYEMPRNALDLSVSKGFGEHFNLKLGVQDLLNARVYMKQDSNANGRIDANDEDVQSYRRGSYFTGSIAYTF